MNEEQGSGILEDVVTGYDVDVGVKEIDIAVLSLYRILLNRWN